MQRDHGRDRAEREAMASTLVVSAGVVLGLLVAADRLAEVPGALAAYAAAAIVVRR